jgi:hypothetical protein
MSSSWSVSPVRAPARLSVRRPRRPCEARCGLTPRFHAEVGYAEVMAGRLRALMWRGPSDRVAGLVAANRMISGRI